MRITAIDKRQDRSSIVQLDFNPVSQTTIAPEHDEPVAIGLLIQKQSRDRSTAFDTMSIESGRQNAGPIAHDGVIPIEIVREVAHMPVLDCPGFPMHHHHASRIPRFHGSCGNERLGQLVIKIVDTHVFRKPSC